MDRRIRQMLRLLPMSHAQLRAQVVLHADDEETFEATLRTARTAGVVVRDEGWRRWLRLAVT
jgi:hypothetical protein